LSDRSRVTSPSPIVNGSLSPDGRVLVTATEDEMITLWDTATGRHRKIVSVPGIKYADPYGRGPRIGDFVFSPDGRHLAVTKLADLLFWDTESGASRRFSRLNGPSVRFLPQGEGVVMSHGEELARGRLTTGEPERTQSTGHEGVSTLSVSADGRLIATGGGRGTIQLWDTSSLEGRGAGLVGHTENVHSLAWSPDGKILASSSTDGTVRWWDVATRQELERVEDHDPTPLKLLFSPDGAILAGYREIDMGNAWVSEVVLWPAARDDSPGE
jgi:WD40 repeat protein